MGPWCYSTQWINLAMCNGTTSQISECTLSISQNAPCAHVCSVWYEICAFGELWIKWIAPIPRYLLNKNIEYTTDVFNPSLQSIFSYIISQSMYVQWYKTTIVMGTCFNSILLVPLTKQVIPQWSVINSYKQVQYLLQAPIVRISSRCFPCGKNIHLNPI